ncbi:MAG: periplasmic heavy metal sensor [Desulfovibrionaceae bacterium]
MTNKRNTTIALATVLALVLAAAAWAGPGHGQGRNSHANAYAQLTPEQQAAADTIFDKYRTKMGELREKLWLKQAELDALVDSGAATRGDIKELVGDIGELRADLFEQREAMSEELEAAGISFWGMGGRGCSGGGYGMMGGQGMMGGCGGGQGMGPGNYPGCPGQGNAPAPAPQAE